MVKKGQQDSCCLFLLQYRLVRKNMVFSLVQHNVTYVELACSLSTVSLSQFNITAGLPRKNEFDINTLDISFEGEYHPDSQPTSLTPL